MTNEDRTQTIDLLESSAAILSGAVQGLTAGQAGFLPGGGSWSILQCVEHLTLTERSAIAALRHLIDTNPPAGAELPTSPDKDELIRSRVPSRARKAPAPEHVHPSPDPRPLAEVLAEFRQVRSETLRFVRSTEANLRRYSMDHFALKTLDGCQWLLLMAAHTQRHAAQIEEIKAQPDYPATSTASGLP